MIWNIVTGQFEQKLTFDAPALAGASTTNYVQWSPSGKWLASGGGDGKIRIWDTVSWQVISTFSEDKGIRAVAWSPDGDSLAATDESRTITFLHSRDWQTEFSSAEGGNWDIHTLSWSPDSKKIAAGPVIIDMQSHKNIGRFEIEDDQGYFNIISVAWTPDGANIAVSGSHNIIDFLDSSSLKYVGGMGCAQNTLDGVGIVNGR